MIWSFSSSVYPDSSMTSIRSRKRRLDGVELIRSSDEHDVGKVEGCAEVVVPESVVLLRIENFQQSGARVATVVGTHLVHLVPA